MSKEVYRYSTALTSQLPFCSTPLRLDPYNNCGFSCAYCFAKTRQGFGREQPLKIANPDLLKKRFLRVQNGEIASALDEFIFKRIPFQLGGMSDPFSLIEEKAGVTLEFINILNEFNYPFIISTKGTMLSKKAYLDVLKDSNCYIRFSTTVIDEKYRYLIDKNCPNIKEVIDSVKSLATFGIPVSFRFQPIIPGHESFAFDLIDYAAKCGVKHISAEYLKVPIDANLKFGSDLIKLLSNNPVRHYTSLGAFKSGREYSLPVNVRQDWLVDMYQYTKNLGLTFGFADNDLLHYSDGSSCCGAADLYLKDAGFFKANILGVIKNKKTREELFFSDLLKHWIPHEKISSYLNSKARIEVNGNKHPEWLGYLKEIWTGKLGIFKPTYFDGVEDTSKVDDFGLPIYIRKESSFSNAVSKADQKNAKSEILRESLNHIP
ncbi:radical SAM protein [Enterobacter cloacae]|uniref:radical SAM protein n=1 Tax=Enterobacter cloacae TaxID=550 RepID=UPI0024DF6526|nr:radical SAM protein [Enterobacter cloacae]EKY4104981.1 radical SAM protein [Enterobacter hormaechei subsp. steigerwaltii]MDK2709158.1 radical SAM protein [Enterobacter cloacae]HDT4166274.1 radical SAM protein [Enterobacter hormaechei subsp. steigerwaltii]